MKDFPEQAYLPKVQLPFYTKPGDCPRKVETERRKRHYASQNLYELLTAENVTTTSLMPREQKDTQPDPNKFQPFLPLEVFDNTENDCRTPEEWRMLGYEEGVRKPVPARALLPARDDMHHC